MKSVSLLLFTLAAAGCSDSLVAALPPGPETTVAGGSKWLDIEYPGFESENLPAGAGILRRYVFEFRGGDRDWVDISMVEAHGAVRPKGTARSISKVTLVHSDGQVGSVEGTGARVRFRLGRLDGRYLIAVDAQSDSEETRFVFQFED